MCQLVFIHDDVGNGMVTSWITHDMCIRVQATPTRCILRIFRIIVEQMNFVAFFKKLGRFRTVGS